ncbi:MAG: dephospho-CoA kinase [Crocinitomicaceae bacterium]|nr:dephospho-CoA kinase [Crocinitomicaceae bacterium]
MKRIGLTGGIGSGKSYIAGVLEKMGYPVYYSDEQAKVLTDTHPEIRAGLISGFGTGIYSEEILNRKELAAHIFKSEPDRIFVNQLIHPVVRADFERWCAEQHTALVFNEAAILFETGAYKQFDATVLVIAPHELRMQRIMERDRCTVEQAEARMKSQWSDEQKIPLATVVITSNGELPLVSQIERAILTLFSL